MKSKKAIGWREMRRSNVPKCSNYMNYIRSRNNMESSSYILDLNNINYDNDRERDGERNESERRG